MALPSVAAARPGIRHVDGILWGTKYQLGTARVIDYSFRNDGYDWTAGERAAVKAALDAWARVANVGFRDAGDDVAGATFAFHLVGSAAFDGDPGVLGDFNPPGEAAEGPAGRGRFNRESDGWGADLLKPGGYAFLTLLHELGHGLGLAHPHDDGGAPGNPSPTYQDLGIGRLDDGIYTLMSYNDATQPWNPASTGRPDGYRFGQTATPMAFDIAAVQHLYGANRTTNAGDTAYTLLTSRYECIWDAGGNDTITAAAFAAVCAINLNQGTALSRLTNAAGAYTHFGGYTIAYDCWIENAIGGSGHDRLTGNAVANRLLGGGGNDTLNGGAGADRLIGGVGNDLYYIDQGRDVVVEAAGQGIDRIVSALSYSLAALPAVENLTLAGAARHGAGNVLANVIAGNALANTLYGADGNDVLAGGAGNDLLRGGAGNDRFVFADRSGDDRIVDFAAGAGRGDVIDLRADAQIDSFAEVLARAAQVGANCIIDLGQGDSLTLLGVAKAGLAADDVLV